MKMAGRKRQVKPSSFLRLLPDSHLRTETVTRQLSLRGYRVSALTSLILYKVR
jgi:hypothetical protein